MSISASQLIGAWEKTIGEHPVDRALTLLAVAHPQISREELALLSIGERDARLLAMRESLLGPALRCVAACPHCSAQLEFSLDARDLRLQKDTNTAELSLELSDADVQLRFRCPNSKDLIAATKSVSVANARRVLAERCVLEFRRSDLSASPAEMSELIVERLADAMAAADSRSDNVVDLSCEACSHRWQLVIDIASFFWEEVNRLAKRLLQQVHTLAWAYGWREDDILAMSNTRREFYLEMVGS